MEAEALARLRACARSVFEGTRVFIAYAFGSRATGRSTDRSDLDVGYYIAPGGPPALTIGEEMVLADRLSMRLGLEVDLRDLGPAPLEARGRVLESGVRILCSDEPARIRLEADLLSRYHDCKEELEAFHEQRLRALAARGR